MIKDVPERPRDRSTHGARAAAATVAALGAAIPIALAGCGGGGGSATVTSTSAAAPTTSTSQSTTTGTSTTSIGGAPGTGQVGHGHTVRQVVDVVLLADDPSKACGGDFVTGRYLRTAYGAKEGCIKAASPSSAVANGLGSYRARTNGDRATVTVRPEGGLYGGERLTISLVNENGSWKVDALKSNAPVGP